MQGVTRVYGEVGDYEYRSERSRAAQIIPQGNEPAASPALIGRAAIGDSDKSAKVEKKAAEVLHKKPKSVLNLSYFCTEKSFYQRTPKLIDCLRFVANLDKLDLSHTHIDEAELNEAIPLFAKNNPGLKKLNLEGAKISSDMVVRLIHAFPELESISLPNVHDKNKVAEALIVKMKGKNCLKSIKGLVIECPEKLIEFAQSARNLRKISIRYESSCALENFAHFIHPLAKNNPNLKKFHFADGYKKIMLPKDLYEAFSEFWPELEDLDLCMKSDMTEDERELVFYRFKKMSVIDLSNFSGRSALSLIHVLSGSLVKIRASEKSFKQASDDFKNRFCSLLASCSRLRKLDVPGLSVHNRVADFAPILPSLEEMNVDWGSLSDSDWRMMGKAFGNKNVKRIWINEGLLECNHHVLKESIQEMVKKCPHLEVLHVRFAGSPLDIPSDSLRYAYLNNRYAYLNNGQGGD